MNIIHSSDYPLVSIIIPCYNHDKYLTECIESIANQTFSDFELIVIDDGSKDNSPKLLSELKEKYNFILILQENHGIAYTLNKGMKELSHGKYITFCASDDYWRSDKLQKQVDFMVSNPEYPMCYSNCYYVDENSVEIRNKKLYRNERKFKGGDIFKDIILINFHPPVSYFYTREILEEINFYPVGTICEDFYMNLQISSKYKIGYINERLFYYRFSIKSIDRNFSVIESQKKIIECYSKSPFYDQAIMNWQLRALESFSGDWNLHHEFFKMLKEIKFSLNSMFWFSIIRMFITFLFHNRIVNQITSNR